MRFILIFIFILGWMFESKASDYEKEIKSMRREMEKLCLKADSQNLYLICSNFKAMLSLEERNHATHLKMTETLGPLIETVFNNAKMTDENNRILEKRIDALEKNNKELVKKFNQNVEISNKNERNFSKRIEALEKACKKKHVIDTPKTIPQRINQKKNTK